MMRISVLLLSCVLLSATQGLSQATNDAVFSLTMNGNDGSPPNRLSLQLPDTIEVTHSGLPFMGFVFAYAPMLSVGTTTFGPLSIDIGPASSTTILADGVTPTTLIDLFANTGSGEALITFALGTATPSGIFGAFQSLALAPSSPLGLVDSAATEIELFPAPDFGSLAYVRSNGFANASHHQATMTGSTSATAPAPGFSFTTTMIAAQTGLHRYEDPSVFGPQSIDGLVNTKHGKIELFTDPSTSISETGFTLTAPGRLPIEIAGSRRPVSATLFSRYGSNIAVSADQSTIAAVDLGSTGGATIVLMKIDGSTFTATASSTFVITPLGAAGNISSPSTRIVGSRVYFNVGNGTDLLSAPIDGSSAIGTPVVFPPLGSGSPATQADANHFHAKGPDLLVVQAGDGANQEDVYVIRDVGGFPTVTNVTSFATPMRIKAFQVGSKVTNITVTPDGSRLAFVAEDGNADELFTVPSDGSSPPQHLSGPTHFSSDIDTIEGLGSSSNGRITAFMGTFALEMDLYDIDPTASPTPTIHNVTRTNGQTGATLPITGSPVARIRPLQIWHLSDRLLFLRLGTATGGTSVGTSTQSMAGYEYASQFTYDVVGDEFGTGTGLDHLPTGPLTAAPVALHVDRDARGWILFPTYDPLPMPVKELLSVDLTTSVAAVRHSTASLTGSVSRYRPVVGTDECIFEAGDELRTSEFGAPGFTTLIEDVRPTPSCCGSNIHESAPGASPGYFFQRFVSGFGAQSDYDLYFHDSASGLDVLIDDTPAQYSSFSVSFP